MNAFHLNKGVSFQIHVHSKGSIPKVSDTKSWHHFGPETFGKRYFAKVSHNRYICYMQHKLHLKFYKGVTRIIIQVMAK